MSGDPVARRYDELHRTTGFGDTPSTYRWIARLAAPARGSRLLDIGCGSGRALGALEGSGVRAIGIDLSRVALERARAAAPSARLVRGDGARLPFPDACFARVLNLGNLEHFCDLAGGVREMRRVLEPEGRAWVMLPNLFYSGVIWRVLRGGEGPNHHQPIDRFATREEWRSWLEWGGLRVLRTISHHKGKAWKRLLPSALAWHFLYECGRGEPGAGPPPPAPLGRAEPGISFPRS
jgi:SAM-dependent methyltransferase